MVKISQSKKSYRKMWTFKQGFLSMKLVLFSRENAKGTAESKVYSEKKHIFLFLCDQIHHTKHQMLHLMYHIILNPKRHQVGHSNKEIRQPKHQVHHLNEKNIPTKTPSTPSNFKRIHQPNHHIRHLNQKNTPNKTPSTPF